MYVTIIQMSFPLLFPPKTHTEKHTCTHTCACTLTHTYTHLRAGTMGRTQKTISAFLSFVFMNTFPIVNLFPVVIHFDTFKRHCCCCCAWPLFRLCVSITSVLILWVDGDRNQDECSLNLSLKFSVVPDIQKEEKGFKKHFHTSITIFPPYLPRQEFRISVFKV